jgi:hypothetical protein
MPLSARMAAAPARLIQIDRGGEPLGADDGQEIQPLAAFGAGRGRVDEQDLGLVLGVEDLAVEFDHTEIGVNDPLVGLCVDERGDRGTHPLPGSGARCPGHSGQRRRPWTIATDFGGGLMRDNEEVRAVFASQAALGRVGEPDDIGGAVTALLSDASRWITAQRLEVSGGTRL